MKGHIQVNNTVFITEVPHFSEHYYTKLLNISKGQTNISKQFSKLYHTVPTEYSQSITAEMHHSLGTYNLHSRC